MENVLSIKNLTKSYSSKKAIDNISFDIKKGEIVGFIGPNGAGKSTTIKILMNLIFQDQGKANIFGLDCGTESKDIKRKVGYVPSEVNFYESVKVKEIIKYAKSFYNGFDSKKIEGFIKKLEIDVDKKMGELSLGNKKKVAIVVSLLNNPELIILDEPTNGLDPLIQQKLFEILLSERENGATIFLSSHNLTEVQNYCDRAIIIKDGKIVDIKDIENIKKLKRKKVEIKSNEIKSSDIKEIGGQNIEINKDNVVFSYEGDTNLLIEFLNSYNILDISIGEEELLDTFMHYYEGDKVE